MNKSQPEDMTESNPQTSLVTARDKRKKANVDFSVEFNYFKEEMRELIISRTSAQEQELKKIAPTLIEIQQSNRNIENSIAFLTAQNEEYKKQIEKLQRQAQEDKKYVTLLEEKIEDMQKGMRKTCFEVKNVPKKESETKEDLIDMITCLTKNIGCEVDKKDIKDIYRVRGKTDGAQKTPIVVETVSTILKNDILKMSKSFNIRHKDKISARHLGLRSGEDTPVFITENLTAKSARLYFLGRDLVKSNSYKFCWTAYGKVYVRKDEKSPVVLIKNESQIQQLMQAG
ncbi:uncharacterized protein LOC106714715 [Papilio machaon]|uniref:uncharacterized protein LOC106714715 n=1 Tax=Papilio machaon TaxID=76193 RepID=UPI001E662E13|nr:uncharacterized protein LOC106714715 [Papilio machaon]